jgi:DNA-binding transcriptional regulator YiaG
MTDYRELIDAMSALGLSEKDTAALLGVPVYTWRKWRKLEREPSSASLQTMRLLLMLDALAPALLQGVREWS